MTVLVTGANGFVARALIARLRADGVAVRGTARRLVGPSPPWPVVAIGDMSGATDWRPGLDGVDTVIHCAARVHMLRDDAADPLAAFRRVNVDATVALARQAVTAGVRRLIFVSSIGVNGAETFDVPFRADDPPAPHSPYAVSKREAEAALRHIEASLGLPVVVVRPPLVYGPDAPGNFATLIRAVDRGLPLPLAAVRNRRSFVAVDNLVDLLAVALAHPAAPGQTWLVSDGDDLSTPDLIRRIARALGRHARLWPIPPALLRRSLTLAGRSDLGQSLCGSLLLDIGATRRGLGWQPLVGVDQALVDTARHYLAAQRREAGASG